MAVAGGPTLRAADRFARKIVGFVTSSGAARSLRLTLGRWGWKEKRIHSGRDDGQQDIR